MSTGTITVSQGRQSLSRKATAIGVAILVHVIIGIIAALIVLLPPMLKEPEIVAEIVGPQSEAKQTLQKKTTAQQRHSTSVSAAAPIANMVRAQSAATFSTPEVKTTPSVVGLGDGDLGAFGGGVSGAGSGASFFGSSSKGDRVIFVLDYSLSMKNNQMDLVVSEMERSLKRLTPNMQYQVIIFAGGGMFAQPGWALSTGKGGNQEKIMTDPKGRKYRFYPKKGATDFAFDGPDEKLPVADWLPATPANIQATMEVLEKKQRWWGTDWRWPFKMAMNMKPPPQTIFFMADGTGGAQPPTILEYSETHGRAQINTFGMHTVEGAKEFHELAEKSGGKYRIVLDSGKSIDGEEAVKNPKSVQAKLGGRGK